MANISWTSNSINNFFNTSLNMKSSPFSGIYGSLNDASMIKHGVYRKLMDSYYSTVSASDKTDSEKKPGITNTVLDDLVSHKPRKPAAVSNKIIDELLSDEKKSSAVSNKVLDELLSHEKKDSAACTYDQSGNKTPAADSTIDTSV